MRGSGSTLSPRPFPIQGKGAALEDISPVAPWEVAQPGQPVKGAEHRRAAAALPLTGSPGCAMGGAATGDKSGRDSVDGTVKTGGGASGHDVQNTYKNTAPILLEAVLCVRLTAYYVISFLLPFVKRRYQQRFLPIDTRFFTASYFTACHVTRRIFPHKTSSSMQQAKSSENASKHPLSPFPSLMALVELSPFPLPYYS